MNRSDFPILREQVYGRPLIYLDNAATSQKPQVVLDAMLDAYTHWNANIHRGVHHLSQVATKHHEDARAHVAGFLHAHSAKEIVFTKGTTDSINMLAFSFGEAFVHAGDEILVSQLEHHSNIVPWQMLCERKKATLRVIPLCDDLSLDLEAFKTLLTPRTRLISVAQVSNVLGIINPVSEIIRLAHAQNIPVCIDGAQSAPHLPIDVQALDCDFFVCSAHKMYGPTGLGVLYGKEQWLNVLPPAEGGGEMIEHVRFEHTTYNQLPYKFEAGTPDFIGSYAFSAALSYMEQIGMDAIAQHEADLSNYAEQQLAQIQGVKVYALGLPKAGVVSFNVFRGDQLIHPFDVGTLLDRQGVAVRTGHHCAEPLIDYLAVPGTVRASFGLYNTREDIDAFIAALRKAVAMLF
ncbi:MAG: cysteine desulfurase [Paludibacteraceae bacterium]|nr:cysteine desulfurase [Bacteroidales bacterium]MDY4149582.1 cysteine desulfurase [Paludibacteraceae bacterium]